jgi:hypothetical protein
MPENVTDGHAHTAAINSPSDSPPHVTESNSDEPDFTTKVATIAVIGVGVALIEVAWIPGMLIGLAAAFAPKYAPKLGDSLRPLLKSSVRGAYKFAQKTRETIAEAGEQVQDIMAEARLEDLDEKKAAVSNAAPTASVHPS